MIRENAVIKCESLFDKNKQHRYSTSKVWSDQKPLAAVISIAPSSDYNVSADLTSQLIQNNLNGLGFGSYTLTNLFSKIGTDFKKLTSTAGLYDKDTDKMIVASCEAADKIIIAWGKVTAKNKMISKRADEVTALIAPFTDKIYFLADSTGRSDLHPLTPALRHQWFLVQATFDTTIPAGSWNGEVQVDK